MKHKRFAYPAEGKETKRQDKQGKLWKWVLFWILVLTPLLCIFVPKIIDDCRLHHNDYVETTARVKSLYKKGKSYNIKCVSYRYCVDNEWYEGHTSPPDSIWDKLRQGSPIEIVYEKGNPSNSNWAGYYKK